MIASESAISQPTRADAEEQGGSGWPTPRRALIYAILALLSALVVFPYLWMLSASLKPLNDVFSPGLWPSTIKWSNYAEVFRQTEYLRWMFNSALVTLLAIAAVAFSSAVIAYPFAKLSFPGKRLFFGMILATMLLPGEVTMVPVFLIWRQLDLVNTLYPLWTPNLFGSAFYIFLIRQFYMTIPNDLKEAALLDGASHFRILWSIMLPLVRPAIVTVLLFEFVAKWNDYLTPLIYLNDPKKYTLAVGVASFLKQPGLESRWDLWMAGSVMMTLPTIVLFFLAQKQFIDGISAGAVKG